MNILGSLIKVVKAIFYLSADAIALRGEVEFALFSPLLVLAILSTGTPTIKNGPCGT